MSKDNILFVGEDDGFDDLKQVTSEGDQFRMPSHAKSGDLTTISLSGGKTKGYGYKTKDGESFVAGEIRDPDPTSNDDYPFSSMNRVIVSHGLRMSGVSSDKKIVMCSGLPIKRYYSGLGLDKETIARKRDNLMKNDVIAADGYKIPKIIEHYVGSEGILAWIDMVIHRKDGKLQMDKEMAQSRLAFADMGGRTTDIALIDDGELDLQKSSTIEAGMLDIKQALQERIYAKERYKAPMSELNKAIRTGYVKIAGQQVDVKAELKECHQSVLTRIHAELKRILNDGYDVDQVVFVGGTAAASAEYINGWFRNQVIADDPSFSNARGACKFAELQYNS